MELYQSDRNADLISKSNVRVSYVHEEGEEVLSRLFRGLVSVLFAGHA